MASAPLGGTPFTMSFTDSAFTGLTVTTVSDNYPNGVLDFLSGDTLLVIWSGTVVTQSTTFQAVFNIGPAAVPEPSSLVLAGIAALAGGLMTCARRRRSFRRLGSAIG